MRTKNEIAEEITALKALKPCGPRYETTKETLAIAIEELETGVDQTADEWDELPDQCRDMVNQVVSWRDFGNDDARPSKIFKDEGLAE